MTLVGTLGLPEPAVLEAAISGVGLASAFQPIVSLSEGVVIGFEALTHWPTLNDPDPEAVFSHAAKTGRLDRLDGMCTDAAIENALRRRLPLGSLLMLNCEPASAYVDRSDDQTLERAYEKLQVMFELTERHLLTNPHALLRKVAGLRRDGFGIALDDVGAHPDSLALLDIICPDVVKLHLDLVQSQPSDDQARVLAAVLAHQERTGAVLLCEGIESDAHLEQALALGADLGQGYWFGRPASLADQTCVAWSLPPMKHPARSDSNSPFDFVAKRAPVRTARKTTLIPFSRHIEAQARQTADPAMVLTALQRAEHFTRRTRDRYRGIAESSPFVAIFGQGLTSELGSGIRGVDLDAADPLCGQWVVLLLGPHQAAALIGREQDVVGSVPDGDRRFDLAIVYDRVLVTEVARILLDRIH